MDISMNMGLVFDNGMGGGIGYSPVPAPPQPNQIFSVKQQQINFDFPLP